MPVVAGGGHCRSRAARSSSPARRMSVALIELVFWAAARPPPEWDTSR